jgi:selenide,water dikinase
VLGRLEPTTLAGDIIVAEGDDAAVYRLPDGTGLVQTVDFFTPIVDDAFDWGRIAGANAMSDIYAMGGTPRLALNVAAWPVDDLPLDLLAEVLLGGAKVAGEAGVFILGGHTITDPEPKYGMAVTGFVDLERIVRNSTAPPHSRLFLTKPLGTGIISTAIKRGVADADQVAAVVDTMTTLNAAAAEAMVEAGAEAATDVTGFGLLGHLQIMLAASGVGAEVDASAIPLLAGVLDLAREGVVPGGTKRNARFLEPNVEWGELPKEQRLVLADAQTSGGLLIAAGEEAAARLVPALENRGVEFAVVGATIPGEPGRIVVKGRLAAP